MLDIEARKKASRTRPLRVMYEEGVSSAEITTVFNGIFEVLHTAGVSHCLEVENLGVWRESGYMRNNELVRWASVDWYIEGARRNSVQKNQLNGKWLMTLLYNEPWQDDFCHYDLCVLWSDMYDEGTNFVIGLAVPHVGTVVSVNRFRLLDTTLHLECIKTEVMHELGHVFGLVPDERTESVEESLGKHCTNRCIMRQGLTVPDDWIRMTYDRLQYGPFCDTCRRDLEMFFQ